MYRFLLGRRWIGLGIFVVFMVVACWYLASWQYDRWEQRKANNARAVAHMALDPVPIDDIIDADGKIGKTAEWTQVELHGQFRQDTNIVVRFVRMNSQAGVQVVTPFELDDGRFVLVNRGWFQTTVPNPPASDLPAPPSGEVTVVGWWHPDSDAKKEATDPIGGSVRAIDSRRWQSTIGEEPINGWVSWREPGQDGLEIEPPPDLGDGPHLFYSIQWVIFGIMAVGGGLWFVRLEVRDRRAQANDTKSA